MILSPYVETGITPSEIPEALGRALLAALASAAPHGGIQIRGIYKLNWPQERRIKALIAAEQKAREEDRGNEDMGEVSPQA